MPHNQAAVFKLIPLSLLICMALMATPFRPGAEVGMVLLTGVGGPIAAMVYAATVLALTVASVIGSAIPLRTTAAALRWAGLVRAPAMLERISGRPSDARLETILSASPGSRMGALARYRYLPLGLLLNLPGNVIIGGGGGLAMLAGLSQVFRPVPFRLTVAVAVSPIPLIFILFT